MKIGGIKIGGLRGLLALSPALLAAGLAADSSRQTGGFLYSEYLRGGAQQTAAAAFSVQNKRPALASGGAAAALFSASAAHFADIPLQNWALDYALDDADIAARLRARAVSESWTIGRNLADLLVFESTESLRAGGLVRTAEAELQSALGGRFGHAALNILGAFRETEQDAVAWQFRGYTGDDSGGNAGLIYRREIRGNLAGINSFVDYETRNGKSYWRWSAGGEFRSPWADAFANYYNGLTDADAAGYTADGYDAELHVHAPQYSWLIFRAGYYLWEGQLGNEDEKGFRGGLRILPPGTPFQLDLEYQNGESGNKWGGRASYRHEFGNPAAGARAGAAFRAHDWFFAPAEREYTQRIRAAAAPGGAVYSFILSPNGSAEIIGNYNSVAQTVITVTATGSRTVLRGDFAPSDTNAVRISTITPAGAPPTIFSLFINGVSGGVLAGGVTIISRSDFILNGESEPVEFISGQFDINVGGGGAITATTPLGTVALSEGAAATIAAAADLFSVAIAGGGAVSVRAPGWIYNDPGGEFRGRIVQMPGQTVAVYEVLDSPSPTASLPVRSVDSDGNVDEQVFSCADAGGAVNFIQNCLIVVEFSPFAEITVIYGERLGGTLARIVAGGGGADSIGNYSYALSGNPGNIALGDDGDIIYTAAFAAAITTYRITAEVSGSGADAGAPGTAVLTVHVAAPDDLIFTPPSFSVAAPFGESGIALATVAVSGGYGAGTYSYALATNAPTMYLAIDSNGALNLTEAFPNSEITSYEFAVSVISRGEAAEAAVMGSVVFVLNVEQPQQVRLAFTPSLPVIAVGENSGVLAVVSASGGIRAEDSFTLLAAPPQLSLNAAREIILTAAFTRAEIGFHTATVRIASGFIGGAQNTETAVLTITVAPIPLELEVENSALITVAGVATELTRAVAQHGTGDYTFSLENEPSGVRIDENGVIRAESSAAAGMSEFTALVRDERGAEARAAVSLHLVSGLALSISPENLTVTANTAPAGGAALLATVLARGGFDGSYTYSLVAGVPEEIALNAANGEITLIAEFTEAGQRTFTVAAESIGAGLTVRNTASFTLEVAARPLGRAIRIGSADQFGVSENFPRGLAALNGVLYMAGESNKALYSINTEDGTAQQIGVFVLSKNNIFSFGLGALGGTLYMVEDATDALYTVNPANGEASQVGSVNNFDFPGGSNAAVIPSDLASFNGTLYMVERDTDALYSLNTTTGAATRIGSANRFGVDERSPRGLASFNGKMYMTGNSILYELSPDTGVATRIGSVADFGVNEIRSSGLAVLNGKLYMVGGATDALYELIF